MIPITIKKLTQILNAEIITPSPDDSVKSSAVSIDSRTTQPGDCFFAISGENFDGHDYTAQAAKNGAVCIVVEKNITPPDNLTPVLKVQDAIKALGTLAKWHQTQLPAKVIAITGSAGKTTTRSIIYNCLKNHFNTLTAKKNFNNIFGLPLTLLNAEPEHEVLVVELGTNAPGEIEYLSKITQPDIALVTNVHEVHLEKLGDIAGVIKEKVSIHAGLKSGGLFIINSDFQDMVDYCRNLAYPFIKFGFGSSADVTASNPICQAQNGTLTIDAQQIHIPLAGQANLQNALAAWAVCKQLNISLENFAESLKDLSPVNMRLQLLNFGPLTVINDCYNASPASMQNALEVLTNLAVEQDRKSVFICGSMGELGSAAESLHTQLGNNIAEARVKLLLATGPFAQTIADAAKKSSQNKIETFTFEKTELLCDNLHQYLKSDDIILIKGSRVARLEKAVHVIEKLFK